MMQRSAENAKISKRNYYMMIIEGSLFWIGASFIDGNAVVSVFINEATGSLRLAGLAAALRNAAPIVAQFLLGMYIAQVDNFGRAMHRISTPFRWVVGLMAPLLLLGLHGAPAAVCLIALVTLFYFSDGFTGLFWTEIGARTVPPKPRAAIQGYQQVFGGLAGLGAAFAVKALLEAPELTFAQRYAWIFGLCGLVYLINLGALYLIRDFPREPVKKQPHIRFIPYVKNFADLWRADGNFRRIMYGRILYVVSSMASSLLVLFGTAYGNLTATQASSMLYVQVLGQVAGGFCWVQVTRRWGNTALMMISHAIPVTVALIGVGVHFAAPATGVSCAIPVGIMVFLSGMNISAWLGFAHRVIDTVDPAKRTGYLVLQSLAQFPFTFASYLAGMVAERFSYLPVFVAILLSSGAGLALTGSLHRSARSTAIRVETSAASEEK